ncbi:MAG: hypothetical protein LBV51_02330, partial [Acholeplasmatales bacterium]|nr:hypothetical protein [Acholeplasmatales bacterium]
MNKNYGNLEINYIFEKIKQYCKTDTARFLYDNIVSFKKQEDVNKELDLTDEVLRLVYKYSVFPFKEDFDILQIISRLEIKSVLSVSEIFNLRLFFIMEQDIIRYFGNAKKSESKYENLDNEYMSKIMSHSKLLREIDDILDPEGQIYDNASTELKKIRKDKLLVSKEITTTLNSLLLKHSSKLSEPIITSKNGRYTLPVITSEKNKISGIVHEVSSSKQTSYIEPDEIRILSNKLESLNHLEEAEIIVIISILSNKMFDYYETIKSNYDIFIRLDYLHAKALFAKEFDCVRQKVNTNKYLKIINGRHPLIDKNKVVPISLILDNQKRTLLVTGPNTGGKTALLKLVGLFALLTMYAVPLPANEGTNINLYNEVYCDIGDNQSISESLSTFSGHLTNIIRIINGLNSNSLILLDELGGGTDPVEGQALAIAIINYIKQFKPHLIVTTHYLELKTFAYSSNDIEVASVAFDADTLQPLYYLNMGIGGASNAILIAKRLGLNSEIIKNASSNKNENASETKILLDRLNDEKVALLKEKANLDKILNDNI